jgi:hypothetical protein
MNAHRRSGEAQNVDRMQSFQKRRSPPAIGRLDTLSWIAARQPEMSEMRDETQENRHNRSVA